MKKGVFLTLFAAILACLPLAALANTVSVVIDTPFGAFVDYQLGSGIFEIGTTGDAFKTEHVAIGKDIADISGTERLRILPVKEGKGKIVITANGRVAATVNVTVKESALEADPDVDKIWFDNGDVRISLDKTEYDRQSLNFYFSVKNLSEFGVKMALRYCHIGGYWPNFDWESDAVSAGNEEMVVLSIPVDESEIPENYAKRLELSLLVDIDYSWYFDDDMTLSNWVTDITEI